MFVVHACWLPGSMHGGPGSMHGGTAEPGEVHATVQGSSPGGDTLVAKPRTAYQRLGGTS